jgi:hypothetical protein
MRADRRASIRVSPPLPTSVVALQCYSSSGFSRFPPGKYLTKISIADKEPIDWLHTKLTCDTADTTRHEPAEPADLASILDMVPVHGKRSFLRSSLASKIRSQEGEHLTEDSYDKNLMADSGRIFATDNPFPIQNPRIPFSTYIFVIALVTAFIPSDLDARATDGSGCRVIKKILSRSSGAVNVRETEDRFVRNKEHIDETCSPAPATPPANRYFKAVEPPNQAWCSSSWIPTSSCSCSSVCREYEWSMGNGGRVTWVATIDTTGVGEVGFKGGLSSALKLTSPLFKGR